ncbi:WXG100 family type VII secretion target, partial [Kitasatospora indigofera]
MADKEKPADEGSDGFQAPKDADYSTWDAASILHIFRGQDKAYSAEKTAGWVAADPESLFQAREAVIDAYAAMTVAGQVVTQLNQRVDRGDFWSGPAASMFSDLLKKAGTVLEDQASSLDQHQARLDETGQVLAITRDGVLEMWGAATKAVSDWWTGLSLDQQWEWMKTHDFPPVEVRDGKSFFRVGDFPALTDAMTKGMQNALTNLASTYRIGTLGMPSPGSAEFSSAGSPAGSPNLTLPAPPQLGDLSAPQLRELSAPNAEVPGLDVPQFGDGSGLGGVGGAGAGSSGAAGGA